MTKQVLTEEEQDDYIIILVILKFSVLSCMEADMFLRHILGNLMDKPIREGGGT